MQMDERSSPSEVVGDQMERENPKHSRVKTTLIPEPHSASVLGEKPRQNQLLVTPPKTSPQNIIDKRALNLLIPPPLAPALLSSAQRALAKAMCHATHRCKLPNASSNRPLCGHAGDPGTFYRQLLRTQTSQKQPELLPLGGPKFAGGDDCFRTPNIQQSLPG